MKHTLTALVILASVACNQNSTASKPTGRDTTHTVVLYAASAPGVEYKVSQAVRFTYDTVMPDPKDKTRNVLLRDTGYNILVIDKYIDSVGNIIKNKAGRDSLYVQWNALNKRIVLHDYNYDYRPIAEAQMQAFKK